MSAIITDQLRILNAKTFVNEVSSSSNSYYVFVGLPNATEVQSDWDSAPPAPKDSFDEENNYWDTMISMIKIKPEDIKQVIRKNEWTSGVTYDIYRHNVSRTNPSQPSGATSLYSSNYYVINSDFRVYVCLNNGQDPENTQGRPSLDEPTFTDLEPRSAGNSGDGYIWKYLYTINPTDIVKFDSLNFIPVPKNWATSADNAAIRENAETSGQLKTILIKNRGVALGSPNVTYSDVPINGDGSGAKATIVINNDSTVESITISNGGSGYTYGTVDLIAGGVPTGTTAPQFEVIIPPAGGHGADIYRELGAYNVLIYSRISNDVQNPDFITGNQIARIGIVESPQAYNSATVLSSEKASALNAIKLTGAGYSSATFTADSFITQTVGTGQTAVGRVVAYDQVTGILKYWQDRSLVGFNTNGTQNTNPAYGYNLIGFTTSTTSGGNTRIYKSDGITYFDIDTTFNGASAVINNKTYYLGQTFVSGLSDPEVKPHSGNIIYVDNRPSITRSSNQKEDIKVILQF